MNTNENLDKNYVLFEFYKTKEIECLGNLIYKKSKYLKIKKDKIIKSL